MKFVAFLAFFAAVACSDIAAPARQFRASNQMLVNETTPVAVFPVTACNGEPLTLSGTMHTMFKLTQPTSGGFNAFLSYDFQLSGYGTVTLAKYEGRLNSREQMEANGASVYSTKSLMHLVSQGSVPNTDLEIESRLIVNANGEATAEQTNVVARCK